MRAPLKTALASWAPSINIITIIIIIIIIIISLSKQEKKKAAVGTNDQQVEKNKTDG